MASAINHLIEPRPQVQTFDQNEALRRRIHEAMNKASSFVWSMQAPGHIKGVFRTSAHHDPVRWPGVLLSGTYDGLMCLDLLGDVWRIDQESRNALGEFIESFALVDGRFANPNMRAGDIFKKINHLETVGYVSFHLTNYALGALDAIDRLDDPNLAFAEPFLDPLYLHAWLGQRDLRDPWQEGNNIVNIGSFLLLMRRFGPKLRAARASHALDLLLEWHDRHQEPATGFWGVGQTINPRNAIEAMAGATHNLHLYYARERDVPMAERMVDYCLTLPREAQTACLDVDPVDILIHLDRLTGYRREEVRGWLLDKLMALLEIQNDDGGFSDEREGVRKLDGWISGYEEPQGLSNCFATFFRCLAIAMIADCLWPGWRHWNFRRMAGIGYVSPRRTVP
ncbi:MAG: hypothetical protein AAFY56_09065 [Pseudomonadota bacterium]